MNKKGFTLIELLAVIVILAIIALIATPIVLKLIDKARRGAAESDAYAYISAVETSAVTYMLDNKDAKSLAGSYKVIDNKGTLENEEINVILKPNVKGSNPILNTTLSLNDKGVVELNSITNMEIGGYVVKYDSNIKRLITDGKSDGKESSVTLKTGVDLNVQYGINKNILLTYFNTSDDEPVTCSTNGINVTTTNEIGENVGVNNTYKVACTSETGSAEVDLNVKSSISLKADADLNVEHGTNKNILSTYFNVSDANTVTCSTNGINVTTTNEIAEKVGINDTYKVTCTSETGINTVNLKVANKLYLYKRGNEFTNITGGWKNYNTCGGCPCPTYFVKNTDNISLRVTEQNGCFGGATVTTNKVNLSKYNKINIMTLNSTSTSLLMFLVSNNVCIWYDYNTSSQALFTQITPINSLATYDISTYDNSQNIAFSLISKLGYIYIYDIYLSI